jgi:type III restriction enzyme
MAGLQISFPKTMPNLDVIPSNMFGQALVKTSLGNVVRILNPLFIVDEFHRMWSDKAQNTLNGLNPALVFGLSATPKDGMNILYKVSGRQLEREEMIKLDLHLFPPSTNGNWREMVDNIKARRELLEKKADELHGNQGTYLRPIALFQVERTGKEQRGLGFVHSEDVREYLQDIGVPKDQIKVKSSALDEIKEEKLLSSDSDVRYIITKEALSEGWDCSFAYLLGIIPNSQSNTSMTQLIGRILRQPYASKTGIRELDESYVYFAEGDTQQVLQKIKQGFEDEGLGDLLAGILPNGGNSEITNPPRQVSIKQSILKNNPESLYLPQWTIKDGTSNRKLVYEIDIKPRIDWHKPNYTQWIEDTLIPSVGKLANLPQEIIYGLEGVVDKRDASETLTQGFDVQYITRRVSEIVENPFVAYEITQKIVSDFVSRKSKEELDKQSGFIANELVKYLELHKNEQETSIFDQLVNKNIITLSLSSDPKIGFELPRKDWLIPSDFDMPYKNSLYEKVDVKSLNSLEKQVAEIIDNQANVLWWTRNKVGRGWYAIQGWQRNKVRPDFIVARKTNDNELEIVYVLESKGEQLLGNKDTEYKKNLFSAMNNQREKIEQIQTSTVKYKLNDKFQFEFVEQKQEETTINLLFNSSPNV